MPYQESSLADRLKQYPEDHRGYATPGVKYGKSGNIQLPHRPTVVSERDLDKRLGMVNGQLKGDKTPFRDNLVPGGLSKKYTPRHVSQQNSIKEKMNQRHADSVANKETHSTVETALESGNSLMELSMRVAGSQRHAAINQMIIEGLQNRANKIARKSGRKRLRRASLNNVRATEKKVRQARRKAQYSSTREPGIYHIQGLGALGDLLEFNRFKSARASVKGIPFKQKPRKLPRDVEIVNGGIRKVRKHISVPSGGPRSQGRLINDSRGEIIGFKGNKPIYANKS